MPLEIYLDNYQNITKKSKTNFLLTFNFLNDNQKKAIYVVYAFSKISDDIVDSNDDINEKIANLLEWENEFINRKATNINLLNELDYYIEYYKIPDHYFIELIDGMRQDISTTRYKSEANLVDYCYKAASTVGLICIYIFGFKDEKTIEYAKNLGIALQLTNIIRDVYEDAQVNRIYIPMEDIRKFSVSETDIKNKRYSPEFKKLMRFQYDRALSFYKKSNELLQTIDQKNMIVAEMMKNIYFEILQKIKQHEFDVFIGKQKISTLKKILIIFKTFIKNR